ncbi:hypothetical protein V6Z11_1Z130200 [Gossypium hirsutum]
MPVLERQPVYIGRKALVNLATEGENSYIFLLGLVMTLLKIELSIVCWTIITFCLWRLKTWKNWMPG